jgi:type IV secretory pathway VirD2 relaxase
VLHPHSHIVIRGVTDDGKILNIAGDYIAHGIRHRAAEIVTLELGMQSEWEMQQTLGREVDQDRFTLLDRAILDEVNEQGLVDLRIGEAQSYLGQANRYLLLERLKKLERMELAQEEEPARWSLSDRMEKTLRELGERGDIIKTMHQAITERGLAHGAGEYIVHDGPADRPVIGRVIGKGLAGDEMGDRVHLVIDGADGRAHYVEMSETTASEVRTGSIVEIGRAEPPPRPADRAIADFARDNGGTYEPTLHLAIARDTVRIAVDHHNTSHPHNHIRIRGVTDDGKILNIAGDYIAHGIRHRAAEIVTLEPGMQSEWQVQQTLGREVDQDRFTRLDRSILDAVNGEGLEDLRIGEQQSWLGGANRYLLIERLKKLERMELAREEEPARWSLSDRMCRAALREGLLQSRCRISPCNGIIRARSKSTPARPYMARLSVFNLLICPPV